MPHCSKSWLAQEIVARYTTSALIWFVPWDTGTQLSTAFRFSSSPRNRKLTLRGQDHSPQLRAEPLPHRPPTTRIPTLSATGRRPNWRVLSEMRLARLEFLWMDTFL